MGLLRGHSLQVPILLRETDKVFGICSPFAKSDEAALSLDVAWEGGSLCLSQQDVPLCIEHADQSCASTLCASGHKGLDWSISWMTRFGRAR